MDAVIKIGGSLALQPEKLRALCEKIGALSKKHRLVVVAGGGEFADTVRELDERFHLSRAASHRMAILGMDQYGLLLADLFSHAVTVIGFKDVEEAHAAGKLPIFLPSTLMFREDPLENSWDITSDSVAVYLAAQLQAKTVLLVTDVDGIYTSDPKLDDGAKLIEKISPQQLLSMGQRTSVDRNLPKMLQHTSLACFVINGLFPERLEAVLEGQPAIYTLICTV